MKRMYAALLALLALGAFGVAASAAQAQPYWLHCVAGAGAEEFTNNQCDEPEVGGGFVWEPVGAFPGLKVKTHGTLTLHALENEITCDVSDRGYVWNDEPGPGVLQGLDSITAFVNSNCKASNEKPFPEGCPTPAIVAEGLPWATKLILVAGVIRDEIAGIEVKVSCGANEVGVFSGTLTPKIVNNTPTFAEFDDESGELTGPGGAKATVSGTDAIEGCDGGGIEVDDPGD